jgi:hypothetical protein
MSGIWPARAAVWLCLAGVFIAPGSTLAASERVRVPKPRPVQAGELPVAQVDGRAAVGLARMPRARPDIEPKTGVAKWAKGAAAHFDEAASVDPVPAATQAILAAGTAQDGAASAVASPNDAPRSAHALEAIDIVAPLPRARPDNTKPELALMMPPPVMPQVAEPVAPEDTGCLSRLRALGAQFTEAAPMNVGGACSVPQPLKVSSLGSGLSIGPETLLNCAEAEALALWMKEVVVPSGRKLLAAAPTRITQDSAYVCRTRYNDPHEKISEHAHANAIDIASIGFDNRAAVDIGRNAPGSAEAKFEAEIRAGSCNYFTTVLGPGSNAAHATHFHLDLAYRRHGYRLCELGAPIVVAEPANTTRE